MLLWLKASLKLLKLHAPSTSVFMLMCVIILAILYWNRERNGECSNYDEAA